MIIADRQTWPDVRLTLHLMPWGWRLKPWVYVDDIEKWRYWTVHWLGLEVHFGANWPMFTERKGEL